MERTKNRFLVGDGDYCDAVRSGAGAEWERLGAARFTATILIGCLIAVVATLLLARFGEMGFWIWATACVPAFAYVAVNVVRCFAKRIWLGLGGD